MNNSTTLTKILNGISTTLNIANKAMPIYKEAKPVLNTIKNTYTNFKNNKGDLKKMINLMKLKNQITKDSKINTNINKQEIIHETSPSNINNPKFFI